MAATEQIGNIGYLAFAPEVTAGTPVATTDMVPLYDESLSTNYNLQDLSPISGNKFETFRVIPGQRSHKGDFTVLAEPNTCTKFFDMLLTRGTDSGTDPHTWPFTLGNASMSYTIDISVGTQVRRYWGVQASKIAPSWNNNEMQLKVSVSALGSFQGREIASISGSGPYTIVFKTDYDTNPTKGLVVGDLIKFNKADGSTINATVASVASATSITTATNPTGVAAGDFLVLRPATIAYNLLPSFLFSETHYFFADTAANAMSASETQVESASTWELSHSFNNDNGEMRSGKRDPDSLARLTGNASLSIKKFFYGSTDIQKFNNMVKSALVIRHYAFNAGKTYELRLTFNNIVTDDPMPNIKSKQINYSTLKYHPSYDQTDGQGMGATVISSLTTIA